MRSSDQANARPVRVIMWGLRAVWVLITLASVALFCASLYYEWQYPRGSGLVDLSTETIISTLVQMSVPLLIYRLYRLLISMLLLPWFVIGIAIFLARSREWVVMLFSIVLITFGMVPLVDALVTRSDAPLVVAAAQFFSAAGFYGFFLSFPLFPDGRLQPRWMRWPMLAMLFVIVSDLSGAQLGAWQQPVNDILSLLIVISFFYAQIYRYRHADASGRQQTKWAVLGFSVAIVMFFLTGSVLPEVLGIYAASDQGLLVYDVFAGLAGLTAFAFVPVAIGLAILRHRLWDVDIIIRRTLVYSVITGILALIYFGAVALMQSMFVALTGNESPLAVVVSTLIIAALFTPVRGRVQRGVDQRFYRRKYDAEKTLDSFAAAVRDEVDIERLEGALLGVVEDTMQPAHVSLWLRE